MRMKILVAFATLLGSTLPVAGVQPKPYPAQAEIDAAYAEAKRLRPSEVYRLFKDKTWLWEDGAANFAKRLRFHAYTDARGNESYAVGYWYPGVRGRLCFRAVWTGKDFRARKRDCFTLRKANGTIYMASKTGKPFIFKSSVPIEYEEISKVVDGNIRKEDFERIRALVRQIRK